VSLRRIVPRREPADHTRRGDQGAGLATVHLGELRHRQRLGLGFEIQCLAADHPARPRGAEQLQRDLPSPAVGEAQRVEPMRQDAGGQRYHLVARARRAGHVERAVRRRPAAPQIVVVHAGEIVVDEGIGMHDFNRRRDLRNPFPSHPSQGFVRSEDERRAQAFAFTEEAVADDFVAALGPGREDAVHAGAGVAQIGGEPAASDLSLHP
jgi:hypothetical protein